MTDEGVFWVMVGAVVITALAVFGTIERDKAITERQCLSAGLLFDEHGRCVK